MEREALKLALEAMQINLTLLEKVNPHEDQEDLVSDSIDLTHKAIAKIKTALAQPEPSFKEWTSDHVRDNLHKLKPPLPVQEPVGWADLQKKAQQIVESKFLWKRFIDGTPLANDIACWMADFARQYTTPPQREWIWLSDADIAEVIDTTCQYTGGYEEYLIKKAERKIKELNT